uniref:Peptidyl-prolyl cis-trans isomerase CYP20-1 n=1 Tax=Rhizophora mucronata TaxID=61149 RepID=A0A2P2KGB0_RHIMU
MDSGSSRNPSLNPGKEVEGRFERDHTQSLL